MNENNVQIDATCANSIELDIIHENELNAKLDSKWTRKAEQELGETPEVQPANIDQLRRLVQSDHQIRNYRSDDAFLLRFLRAKKFDIDKAFRMMQKYYKMKKESPDLFQVSPSSEMDELLSMQMQQMLPDRDENGRVIYVFRVQNCDPYKCAVEKVFRSNVLSLENAIRDPCNQIGGLVVLLDMAGIGFAHAKFLSPHLAKRTVEVIQEAFPMRFKAFHILHEPFYFDAILAILRPFLKEKIRRRIILHGHDLTSLHRHIPREALPAEYGGFQPPFDNTKWRQQICRDEQYFTRLESYKIDFMAQAADTKSQSGDGDSGNVSSTSANEANQILNELMQPKNDANQTKLIH